MGPKCWHLWGEEPGTGLRTEGRHEALSGGVLAGSVLFSLSPTFGLGKMVTGARFSLSPAPELHWTLHTSCPGPGLLEGRLQGYSSVDTTGLAVAGCPAAPLAVCRVEGAVAGLLLGGLVSPVVMALPYPAVSWWVTEAPGLHS